MEFSNIHRYEPDLWGTKAKIFTTKDNLELLQSSISKGEFLVVEHWHYRGASCPTRMIIEDYEDFIDYLASNAIAGDIIDIYNLTESWNKKELFLSGKCPDKNGEVPEKGAY